MAFGVNDLHGSSYIAATAADLARREPFRLGDTLIAPASREISGPGGKATVEPRIMQVLLALVDAAGAVVTRDDLISKCWNNQIVGEDAINRAVAGCGASPMCRRPAVSPWRPSPARATG